MSCKSCRRKIFDWRDGNLAASEREAVRAHLDACPACRAFYEEEARLGARFPGAFAHLAAGRRTRRSLPATGRLRWAAAAGAAALLALIVLVRPRPLRPLIQPTSPEAVVLDDFPDPLRDWTEGRVVITVEDASGGGRERFLATKDGAVRRIADKERS